MPNRPDNTQQGEKTMADQPDFSPQAIAEIIRQQEQAAQSQRDKVKDDWAKAQQRQKPADR